MRERELEPGSIRPQYPSGGGNWDHVFYGLMLPPVLPSFLLLAFTPTSSPPSLAQGTTIKPWDCSVLLLSFLTTLVLSGARVWWPSLVLLGPLSCPDYTVRHSGSTEVNACTLLNANRSGPVVPTGWHSFEAHVFTCTHPMSTEKVWTYQKQVWTLLEEEIWMHQQGWRRRGSGCKLATRHLLSLWGRQ